MVRAILLACASIVILTVSSCTPSPVPSSGPALPPPIAAISPLLCDKTAFLNKVLYRSTDVLPTPGSTPPTTTDTWPGSPDYKTDLGKAFDVAPPNFQMQLCNLDVVYVHESSRSWGWQQKQKVTVGNGKLVAL